MRENTRKNSIKPMNWLLFLYVLFIGYFIQSGSAHSTSIAEETGQLKLEIPSEISISEQAIPVRIWNTEKKQDTSLDQIKMDMRRTIHALYISKDLNHFGHVHPEDLTSNEQKQLQRNPSEKNSIFLPMNIKKAGEYLLVLGFQLKPTGNRKRALEIQLKKFFKVVDPKKQTKIRKQKTSRSRNKRDKKVSLSIPRKLHGNQVFTEVLDLSKSIQGHHRPSTIYFAQLNYTQPKLIAKKCVSAQVNYYQKRKHQQKNTQFTLSPYLNAGAHITLVNQDLSWVGHTHAVPTEKLGDQNICQHHTTQHQQHTSPPKQFSPSVTFDLDVPKSGMYKIFVQVANNRNELLVHSFDLTFF